MIIPSRLFQIRLKRYIAEQARVWRSALDWTVWLYFLIPLLLIGGGIYVEWWQAIPEWTLRIPWKLYPLVMFLLLLTGRLRVFTDEADRLFLLQRADWLRKLTVYGIGYTFVVQAITLTIPFALLYPFLVQVEGMNAPVVLFSYFYTLAMKMSFSVLRHLLDGRWRGWRKWTLESVALLVNAMIYTVPLLVWGSDLFVLPALLILSLLVLAALIYAKLKLKPVFEADVNNERKARLRSTELLVSQVIESKPLIKLSRPLIFSRSGRVFRRTDPGTMLAEMRMKAFVRKLSLVRGWLGFISLSTYALTLTPGPVACGLVVLLIAVGSSWLNQHWKQWFEESFIKQFPWTDRDGWRGAALSQMWMLLPGIAVWSAAAGWKLSGIIGAGCGIVIAASVWWLIHRYAGRAASPAAALSKGEM